MEQKNTMSKKTGRILLISFAVILIIIYLTTKELGLVGGLLLAFGIGYAIYIKTINEEWSGKITKVYDKKIRQDNDGFTTYKTVRYATVEMDSGKIKNKPAHPDWKVGDKVVKEKGSYSPIIKK